MSTEESSLKWARVYGDDGDEVARTIIQTDDGGYAFAGGKKGAWLVKMDDRGKVQWTHSYRVSQAFAMIQTRDGGFVLAGGQFGGSISPLATSDVWLLKTDAKGDLVWTRTYDWQARDDVWTVLQAIDGGYVLGGSTRPNPGEGEVRWAGGLAKTDTNGTLEWVRIYEGWDQDRVYAVIQTSDGGFALAGETYSYGSGAWLVKTDAHGGIQWNQTYSGPGDSVAYAVVQTPDRGFALAGYQDGNAWLVKTDVVGTLEWNRTYVGPGTNRVYSMIPTTDGGFALVGYTRSYGAGRSDAWLVKTDAQGMVQWNRTYGGAQEDIAYTVIETNDRGFALVGHTTSYGAGGFDAWVVKTDAWGFAPEPEITSLKWVVLGVSGSLALIVITMVLWWRKKRK